MILAYGGYRHALAEASITIERQGNLSPAGLMLGWRERWRIDGRLQAANPAALTAAITSLENAYKTPNQDLVLYLPDGTATAHQLRNRPTMGGVRVTQPPSYPLAQGAEYSNYRSYTIEVTADVLAPATGASLLIWDEALTFSGGGPRWAYLPTLLGPPVRQQLQAATAYRVTQTGRAVGLLAYPTPAEPLWPDAWHRDQGGVTRRLPERVGTQDVRYAVDWTYHFESTAQLSGGPTPRPV